MSKSKGNVIDPLNLCDKYGADAVRYTLASMSSPGRDLKMNDQSVETGRNFLTKLWNIVRFSQMNGCVYNKEFAPNKVTNHISRWIIYKIKQMILDVENSIENYRFDDASRHIYHCIWDSFCDWYIEFIKPILQHSTIDINSKNGYDLDFTLLKKDIRDTTSWAILQFVRVLYPIAPFISKKLSGELGVLDITWPDVGDFDVDFTESVKTVELLKETITSIRSMRQYLQISPSQILKAKIETSDENYVELMSENKEIIKMMAGIENFDNISRQTFPVIVGGSIIHIEFSGEMDVNSEKQRLKQEIEKLKKIRNDAMTRLSNKEFLAKAADDIIQEHKNRVEKTNDKIQRLDYVVQSLASI
jgi:valyl-tRNA synthetase